MNTNHYNQESIFNFYHKEKKNNKKKEYEEKLDNIEPKTKIIEFHKIDEIKKNNAVENILNEIRNEDYKKDCPILQFGEGNNLKNQKEFFLILDEYFVIIQNLNEIFEVFEKDKANNSIEGIKKIIDKIDVYQTVPLVNRDNENTKELNQLYEKTKELNTYFKVEFTNTNYKCQGVQEKINNLREKVFQLMEYINRLLTLIEGKNLFQKINKLKTIKEGYKFFDKKLDLFLPQDKPSNKIINFNTINEKSDLLKLPIISIINNSVSCSYQNLKLNFGPYISSIYQEPIKINFISLVKNLSMSIEDISQYKEFIKCNVNDSNGLAQLEVMIPKMENKEKNIEKFNINFKIEFKAPGFSSYLLECKINIEVIPLNIIAYCKEYNLSKIISNKNNNNKNTIIENEYNLCLTKILTGTPIHFVFKNYNIDKELDFTYKIESLQDNTAKKPKIEKSKGQLTLILGNEDEETMQKLYCNLFINFYNYLNLTIRIKCNLIPFDIKFEVYDYNKKMYANNIDLYVKGYKEKIENNYITKIRPNKFPLHFQVILKNFEYKGEVEFYPQEENEYITIENNNIPKCFENDFTFDLDINIKDDIISINNEVGYKKLKKDNYIVILLINNIEYSININFKIIEEFIQIDKVENFHNFSLEKFREAENWIQVKDSDEFDCNAVYVSLFGLEPSFKIDYEYYYNNKDCCLYAYSSNNSENHLLAIKIIKLLKKWETIKNLFKTKYSYLINCELYHNSYYYYKKEKENEKSIGIVGYIGKSKDCWYPTFSIYEDYFEKKIKDIEMNNNKNEEDYKTILNDIVKKCKKKDKMNYSKFAKIIAKLGINIDEKSIFELINLLLDNIKKIINNSKLSEIVINDSPYKSLVNVINLLYSLFKERYEYIQKSGFTIIPKFISKEKILKKSDELLEKYFSYDKPKAFDKKDIKKLNKDNISKEEIKAVIIKEGNDKNIYLTSKNIDPNYSLSQSSLDKEEVSDKATSFKTEEIQDITYPQEWSINSLSNFFMKSIKETRELPLFILNAKLENNNNKLEKTQKLYVKLLDLYENTPEVDDSFIGDLILTFNEQFEKMTNNLLYSNIYFSEGVLPKKLKIIPKRTAELNKQYIIFPKEAINNEIPEKTWEIQNLNNGQKLKGNKKLEIKNYINQNLNISENDLIDINKDIQKQKERMKREEEERKKKEQRKTSEKQSTEIKTIINNEQKEEKKIISEEEKPEGKKSIKIVDKPLNNSVIQTNNDKQVMEINKDTSIKKEEIKIDVSTFNYNDEILLKLVVGRMKEIEDKIKNNKQLPELGIKKNLKGQPDYRNEKPSSNNFNVINLYERGMSLTNKIVKNISEKAIPFSDISVNLLIDCSGFINIENKLKQFVIICGIINALNIVNIPYAISLVGDSQFECSLKPFDLDHSMENLQKILDCLFIKRFVGKNAKALQYAIEYTKAKSYYRVILMFTDGLDEDFLLIDSWKKKLFIDPKLSFGFFFINSENICNKHSEELDYLKIKWDEFKNQIKDTSINIELIYYKSTFEDYNKLYDDIAYLISNLLERPIDETKIPNKDNIKLIPPTFDLSNEENLDDILRFDKALEDNYENKPSIFIKKTEVLKNIINKTDKLDVNPYKNKLSKIVNYNIKDNTIKSDIHSYVKKYLENRSKLNKAKIEAIFKPNKPSQKVLSTTGTEFDIPALIMNLINPSPEPMIYLEEKGGMIRNYSVSLVLDTSYSCFNPLCFSFSLQTLRLMLSTFNSIDLPCFDLILSRQKNPEILCSNLSSVRAINPKSTLWESLISILDHPCSKSDLASAIEAVFDLKRMRASEYTSYLFVLTDGLYQENEHKRILKTISNCVKSGLNVFGIGIGIYPIRIEKLFPKIIYCHNPYNLNKAIANFFGESISGVKNSMIFMDREEISHIKILNEKIEEIINNSMNLNYQNLYNKLNEVTVETDAFLLISNQEDEMNDTGSEVKSNPKGEGKELLKKDQLKGHKILIVMLWSKTLNPDENQCIHKDYITKVSPESKACLKDALDHLGVIIDVVENYRDAITRLTSKNQNGKCPYYACWIINGPPYEDLPDGSNEGFLFGQFLEVLKLFWERGGALIFLAEGWKLQYQTNEFLKLLEFDGKKVNFYLVGDDEEKNTKEHVGGKILEGDRTGELKEKQKFSKKIEKFGIYQRLKIDHNLFYLFEGDTICYISTDDYNQLLPFHPFSRDSDNGISSLFYLSDNKRGDIFIDCGFTKMFINMEKEDTAFKYFQNIASWSARTEIHLIHNEDIEKWRPEGIDYTIDVNKKWTNFKKKPSIEKKVDLKTLKTLFAFDNSGSISGNSVYFNEINRIVNKYYKPGDKFYLWGSQYTEKTKSEIDQWIISKYGPEGTYSVNIAKLVNSCPTHREHLIIVTDGQVSESDIRESDSLMNQFNIQFQFVSVYVIGTGGNLSVGAPFCRGCPNRTIHVINANQRINGPSLSLDEISAFNSIININSIPEFDSKFDKLFSVIKAKQLGKNRDDDLKNKLSALKTRLINNISGQQKLNFEEKWNKLFEMANNGVHDFKIGTAGIKK